MTLNLNITVRNAETRHGIPFATVKALGESGITDQLGKVTLTYPGGFSGMVEITANGYQDFQQGIETRPDGDDNRVFDMLPEAPTEFGGIAGTVKDSITHQAIRGARVQLLLGSSEIDSDTTNSSGAYDFDDIAVGRYRLRASDDDYISEERNVDVQAAATVRVDIVLRPGEEPPPPAEGMGGFRGFVVKAGTQERIEGVHIHATNSGTSTVGDATTTANGEFEILNLPEMNDKWRADLSKEGFETENVNLGRTRAGSISEPVGLNYEMIEVAPPTPFKAAQIAKEADRLTARALQDRGIVDDIIITTNLDALKAYEKVYVIGGPVANPVYDHFMAKILEPSGIPKEEIYKAFDTDPIQWLMGGKTALYFCIDEENTRYIGIAGARAIDTQDAATKIVNNEIPEAEICAAKIYGANVKPVTGEEAMGLWMMLTGGGFKFTPPAPTSPAWLELRASKALGRLAAAPGAAKTARAGVPAAAGWGKWGKRFLMGAPAMGIIWLAFEGQMFGWALRQVGIWSEPIMTKFRNLTLGKMHDAFDAYKAVKYSCDPAVYNLSKAMMDEVMADLDEIVEYAETHPLSPSDTQQIIQLLNSVYGGNAGNVSAEVLDYLHTTRDFYDKVIEAENAQIDANCPGLRPGVPPPPPPDERGILVMTTSPPEVDYFSSYGFSGNTGTGGTASIDLPPGSYGIDFSKEGYRTLTRTAIVRAGETTNLSITLQRTEEPPPPPPPPEEQARLEVSSDPTQARIYIDDQYIFEKTNTTLIVVPGSHKLTLKKDRYHDISTNFSITAGQRLPINLTLVPLEEPPPPPPEEPPPEEPPPPPPQEQTGTIMITTVPVRCTIDIPGVGGFTSNDQGGFQRNLTPGSYEILFSKAGYRDETKTAIIVSGQIRVLTVILEESPGPPSPEEPSPPGEQLLWVYDVDSIPQGGKILINGSFVDKWTPDYINLLPNTTYTVGVVKSGYVPASTTITTPPLP